MSTPLGRRYERLLAAYPPQWRAEHGPAVLGTLLDAAAPDQRWPSPREAGALLIGAVGAHARQTAAADPRRPWTDGLHLGAVLLATAAVTGTSVNSFDPDLGGLWAPPRAVLGSSALFLAYRLFALAVVGALVVFVLRGPAVLALAAAVINIPVGPVVLRQIVVSGSTGGSIVWWIATTLPLPAVLAVLVRTGGFRPARHGGSSLGRSPWSCSWSL